MNSKFPLVRNAARPSKLIGWLRVGYPSDTPTQGHSPLLALNGPLTLTAGQFLRAINEIDCCAPSATDIEVAITKATNQMPTPAQVGEVSRALKRRST